ncbi:unnamed protein product [Amoebophrya sp. A25]|nr:unnamed protein product [Amoebophrya sp. A25]|eukprot:GSA25T00015885001.1
MAQRGQPRSRVGDARKQRKDRKNDAVLVLSSDSSRGPSVSASGFASPEDSLAGQTPRLIGNEGDAPHAHASNEHVDAIEVFVEKIRGFQPGEVQGAEIRLVAPEQLFGAVPAVAHQEASSPSSSVVPPEGIVSSVLRPHMWCTAAFPVDMSITEIAQQYVQLAVRAKGKEEFQLVLPVKVLLSQEVPISLDMNAPPIFKNMTLWRLNEEEERRMIGRFFV